MKQVLVRIINFYQRHISVFFKKYGVECKYYPSCSEYTRQAVEKYGAIKGALLGTKRILKCNPFSKGGYDPLK